MKINFSRSLIIGICVVLALVMCISTISAKTDNTNTVVEENEILKNETNELNPKLNKEETVYVFADNSGNSNKIIVSDWIKGHKDQYNKYETNEDLPVVMHVSYKLDGKDISAKDLAGKAGSVEITYSFENRETATVNIDGYDREVKIPFVTLSAVILDNNNFSDVEVVNGHLINDGNRSVVVGLTLPGLKENINQDINSINLNDSFTIKAKTSNFSLSNTLSLISNDLFNDFNLDDLTAIDELSDGVNEMSEAVVALIDGANKLEDGNSLLLNKSIELSAGVDALNNGGHSLQAGSLELINGINALDAGINELNAGLNAISTNSSSLNEGSRTVFDTLIQTANAEIAESGLEVQELTIENYAEVLNAVIESLDETNVAAIAKAKAREAVEAKVESLSDYIKAEVTKAVRAEVENKVKVVVKENVLEKVVSGLEAKTGINYETYKALLEAGKLPQELQVTVDTMVEIALQAEDVKALIEQNIEAQMASADIQNLISATVETKKAEEIEKAMNSSEVQAQITAALEQASSGAAKLSALKGQLDAYNTFYVGLNNYTNAVDTAAAASDKLKAGSKQLSSSSTLLLDGVNVLVEGLDSLKLNVPALIDGVSQLSNGSKLLNEGLHEFDNRAISSLKSAINDELSTLVNSLKETVEASKTYTNYSGDATKVDGLKFIYRTEEVK